MTKKKSNQLNLYTFVLSIMVVMIHNQFFISARSTYELSSVSLLIYDIFRNGFLEMAVPGFFIISGYLLFRKFTLWDYPAIIKKRVHTLFIPYLLWNIISIIYNLLITRISFLSSASSAEAFTFSPQNIIEGLLLYKYNVPFWYFFELMLLIVVCPLIYLAIQTPVSAAIYLILVFLYYTFIESPIVFSRNGLFLFSIGAVLGHFFPEYIFQSRRQSKQKLALYVLGILLFTFLRYIIFCKLSGFRIIYMIGIIFGIGILYCLWAIISQTKAISYAFPTFAIYAMHWYILSILQKLLLKALPHHELFAWLGYFGATALSIAFILCIAYLWKKIWPASYYTFTGHR